jgi:hypothetical protein
MRFCTTAARDARVLLGFATGLASLAACGSSAPSGDGTIALGDANNYSTTASLQIPFTETAAATDLDICWSGIVDDLQCHAVAAQADIDDVALIRISRLSESDVAQRLATGTLSQSSVDGYLDFYTDHSSTCAKLSQLSFNGTAIDVASKYVESTTYTYLLLFTKGTRPGVGARTMTFLHPKGTSTNTHVDAPTGCGLLTFSADLTSLTPVAVPAAGPWVVDWHALTRDGQGNPPPFQSIDGLTLGFYAGMTATDIQTRIFDLETIATTLWDIQLPGGKTADLAQAKDRVTGAAFTGFAGAPAGTWMLALTCSRCSTPAPVLLTIIDPTGGGAS